MPNLYVLQCKLNVHRNVHLRFFKVLLKNKCIPKVFLTLTLPAYLQVYGNSARLYFLHTTNILSKEVFDKETFNKVNTLTNQNETLMK